MTMELVTLKGRTIQLLPLELDQIEALCEVGLDPELWRQTTIQVSTRAEMKAYVQAALSARDMGTALPFVLVETATGKIIGTTRYHTMVPEHRRLEIGFTWIARAWQRTVANTEAKYLLLRHAFDGLGCVRVEFKADAENEQSCRALRRIGAVYEGTLRSYRLSASRGLRDLAVFSIIVSEWPSIRSALEQRLTSRT